jgi:hypothetical protein
MAVENKLGQGNTAARSSTLFPASVTIADIPVAPNANRHNVAIESTSGGAAGTAALTAQPVGLTNFIPVFEIDGSTPVVMNMPTGDARADIRGSLSTIRCTIAGFDSTEYKIVVASYID